MRLVVATLLDYAVLMLRMRLREPAQKSYVGVEDGGSVALFAKYSFLASLVGHSSDNKTESC